jgi:lipopolysaccharide transport system ATP-binding protein
MGSIVVSNLGKAYKQYPNRWSRLLEWVTPGKAKRHKLKWVLQGVGFTVRPGEAVGIIGINGAGKSTLLKLITGTTQPSTGSVHMTGRVAALLELGMGFHPDFTGRQNAFMAGQLLGMSSEDIARLMPEIEAFAEIGDYIDQPVRVYSSGMQMRLAFSVATAIRPDILIVDEALSVGDAYFQHKSFARIREFREKGTTLLIVSHDSHAILSVCDRAILLSGGKVSAIGEPEFIISIYDAEIRNLRDWEIKFNKDGGDKGCVDSGSKRASIFDIELLDEFGKSVRAVGVGQNVAAMVSVKISSKINKLVFGFGVKDRFGQMMFGANTLSLKQDIINVDAGAILRFKIEFPVNLGVGNFSIHCSVIDIGQAQHEVCHWIDRGLVFEVINLDKPDFIGLAWNDMKFDFEMI